MFNAVMTINDVALNIECFTRVIRRLRQCFQATGRIQDRPVSGRPRVTTRAQELDRFIRNTHPRNCFETATATGTCKTSVNLPKLSAIAFASMECKDDANELIVFGLGTYEG
jgi:hypothetical protein